MTTSTCPGSSPTSCARPGELPSTDQTQRAGVWHHVLLSILGVDRVEGNAHHADKREQERLVTSGSVPWTIGRTSQLHDFAEMVASWTERDGTATIAPTEGTRLAEVTFDECLAEQAG